ncbi:hypothetical protein HDU93_001036 [Gonapodya sp. JEL0774]|nr:hypothetical protein HDU93_001036 [Gonapodya sp. JEL0774]
MGGCFSKFEPTTDAKVSPASPPIASKQLKRTENVEIPSADPRSSFNSSAIRNVSAPFLAPGMPIVSPPKSVLPTSLDEVYPFNLGEYQRTDITSTSEDAKTWCKRGMLWAYAFNSEESSLARTCAQRAADLVRTPPSTHTYSPFEVAVCEAKLAHHWDPVTGSTRSTVEGTKVLDWLYVAKLRAIYDRYGPQDPDVACLAAESLMLCYPWRVRGLYQSLN